MTVWWLCLGLGLLVLSMHGLPRGGRPQPIRTVFRPLRWPTLRLRSRTGHAALEEAADGYGPAQVAVVACRATSRGSRSRFAPAHRGSCLDLHLQHGGTKACAWACLGEGDCAAVCAEGAIRMEDGLPQVDAQRCTGCGDCIPACPRQVLALIPAEAQIHLACASAQAAEDRNALCSSACHNSRNCLDTRHVANGLVASRDGRQVVDYTRSANLLPLLSLCPSGALRDRIPHRPWFTVNERCTGCGDCIPLCPAAGCMLPDGPAAPTPLGRARVRIVADICTGCGLCLPACEPQAIRVVGALGYGGRVH